MKMIRLIVAGTVLFVATALQAQVSINVNLGAVPPWMPRAESNVRYYYLPDLDAYYDLRTSRFLFSYNGAWIQRRSLPDIYRNYNLYEGRKVVVRNYCGDSPYKVYRDRNWNRGDWAVRHVDKADRSYDNFSEREFRDNRDQRDVHYQRKYKHEKESRNFQRRDRED